jgi:hypothetical protein
MKKLKLDLDALQVETFEAERAPEPRGTVQAHASSGDGGIFECANQCVSGGVTHIGCASDFGCASVHCSGGECNSLSGCVSYEVINCGTA